MAAKSPERVIEVDWGQPKNADKGGPVYPVDVAVEAADRQGSLRDISDVFAREKTNVIGVQTQSVKGTAWMTFTVEVADSGRLNKVLGIVANVSGGALGKTTLNAIIGKKVFALKNEWKTRATIDSSTKQARSSAG